MRESVFSGVERMNFVAQTRQLNRQSRRYTADVQDTAAVLDPAEHDRIFDDPLVDQQFTAKGPLPQTKRLQDGKVGRPEERSLEESLPWKVDFERVIEVFGHLVQRHDEDLSDGGCLI